MSDKFDENALFVCRKCGRSVSPDRFTRVMYFGENIDIKNYVCPECLIPNAIDAVTAQHLHLKL